MHITLHHGDCLRVAALFCSGLRTSTTRIRNASSSSSPTTKKETMSSTLATARFCQLQSRPLLAYLRPSKLCEIGLEQKFECFCAGIDLD